MKKIIMLITMFVLSVGFLMAQNGVFNYQAVVVDADGNLVVDQDVTADVYVYDATGTVVYQDQFTNVHSSLNAMVVLPIGSNDDPAFAAVDWKTASVKVVFTAADVTIPDYGTERVPGVPYALQSMDDELTTEMIVDYYSRATTTMDDMEAIFDALESNPSNLAADWKAAFIDTIINNRDVAKEIVLHYLNTGTADDVQAMFEALSTNDNAMTAIIADVKDLIGESPSDVREIIYDILSDYTRNMTPTDVNDIYTHLSDEVKLKFAQLCVEYLKTHKASVIMPIAMNYMEKITVGEFDALVNALVDNTPVYEIMHAQFNTWLDEYFASRYSGGNHVKNVVASAIEAGYYEQCTPPVDLCELKENLDALQTCFALKEGSELSFVKTAPNNYACIVEYVGSDPTNAVVTLEVATLDGTINVTVQTNVNVPAKKIVMIAGPEQNMPELLPGDYFTPTMTVTVGCSDDPINITGVTYIEP